MASPNPPANPTPTTQTSPTAPATLFAPWRQAYVENVDSKPPAPSGTGSFLLDYWLAPDKDEANHVIVRDNQGLILLNKYPYAGGHLLVALGEARPRLMDYDATQRAALWSLVERAADILDRGLLPQGVNIGINQGRAAGAGVPQHLHVHLVPRWSGDVNFMAAVGQVRVIPSSLEDMAKRLRAVASS